MAKRVQHKPRRRVGLKEMGRRGLSMLMAMIMVISLIQISAFAYEPNQVMDGYFTVNKDGQATEQDGTNAPVTQNGYTVSKTINQTGENAFDITLEVQTEQTVTTNDAAVVLVLDTSASMSNRMNSLRTAAKEFVSSLVQNNEGGKIYVSVVGFGGYAYKVCDWTDVTADGGVWQVQQTIETLEAGSSHSEAGGTNLEAGLMLARNRLKMADVAGASAKYTVLFTDGEPTYRVKNESNDTNYAGTRETGGNTADGYWGGGECSEAERNEASDMADEVKQLSQLYTICYGVGENILYGNDKCVNCQQPRSSHDRRYEGLWPFGGYHYYCRNGSGNEYRSTSVTMSQYLENEIATPATADMTYAFDAEDSEQLNAAFADIASSVSEGSTGAGTKVVDPMGEFINFGQVKSVKGGTASTDASGRTLTWTLNPEDAETSTNGGKTTYTFTLIYSVILNTLKAGFAEGTEYPTNGYTRLEIPGGEDVVFPVPGVHGYADDLTFTKQAYHNEDLKLASSFKLAHSGASCGCGLGTWDVTANSVEGKGTVTFANIPSGHTYTLTETKAQGGYMEETKAYTVQVAWGEVTVTNADDTFDGAVFFNKLDPKNQSFDIIKTWAGGVSDSPISVDVYRQNDARDDDQNKTDGDTPDTFVETVTITAPGWTGSTSSLPTVDQKTGEAITYYVKEQPIDGYEVLYGGNQNVGFTITNNKVENGTVTVKKEWNAPEDYYQGLTVVVDVYQDNKLWKKDVILNEGNNWTMTYEDVPTQVGGVDVIYRVEEKSVNDVAVENSAVTVEGHTYSVATSGTTVTNTLQNETVTFSGTKTWKDNNNAYGTRPDSITIQVKNGDTVVKEQEISAKNDWSYSITVPKFDENYNEIQYTVVEVVDSSVYAPKATENGFTNTLTDTVDIDVKKVWDVPEGFFGTSEVEVTPEVEATVDAEGNEIPGTPATYQTVNNPAPDVTVQLYRNGEKVEGKTLKLSETNDWEGSFAALAKYDQNGVKYNYTVKETIDGTDYDNGAISMAGKAMSVSITGDAENGFTVTNSAVGETSVTVNKIWVDGSNVSNTRPETIYVSLFADGALERTVPMTGDGDQWTYTFENLAAYNGDEAIEYTVAETDAEGNVITTLPAAVESDSYNVSQNGYTITNTLAQRKDVSVSINKTWVDGDNKWDTRPDTVTFEVLADGEPIGRTISLSANSNLTVSMGGLDRYNDTGAPIEYTLKEQTNSDGKVEGKNGAIYTPGKVTSTDGYNFTATNTLDIPTTDLYVSKTWIDGNKNHGNDSVTAVLVVNGVVDENRTVVLKPGYGWKGVFEDLPKYSDDYQTQYTYSVQEKDVPIGYTVSYNGGQIINTIEDPMDVELTITKTWVGPEDQRPEYVTVGIFRASQGGEPEYVTGADVYLTAPTGEGANQSVWTATSESLDRYDAQGYPYTYSIRELDEGTNKWVGNGGTVTMGNLIYDVKINGFQITNTVQQSNDVTVSGTKTWSNVPENLVMPKSIQVILWADGGFVSIPGVENPVTVTPDEEGNWTYTFENLPRYAVGYGGDGHEIVYTVSEYGADVNGDIILGDHHFNVQGGTKNENGTYDLVNTYQSTDRYYYKVVGVYHTYHEDTGITDSVSVDLVAVTEGVKGETYTFDPNTESYLTYNGNAYEFDADNAGNTEPSVTLNKANEIYTVYFHYTRTEKDDTDPGGGGGDGTTYYNLVVKYLEEGTDEELATSYTKRIAAGRSYDVTAQTEKLIDGYEISQVTGDDVAGYMNGDREIIVYYTVDIDDGETPLDPGPGGGGDGDGTDIGDGEVPLDPGSGGDGDGTDIGDENVPQVPATGDNLALWVMAAVASAAGLVYLTVAGKKREKDNT